MDKLNTRIRLSSNTSVYIVTTSKTTSLNSYLSEFAYNNALSATTGVSPFFANKGYYLNITVHPKHDITSFQARNFVIDLNELQSTLKAEISIA